LLFIIAFKPISLMRKEILAIALCLLVLKVFPQVNIGDSLRSALRAENHDTVKIDKLNNYIFSYVTSYPESVLIFTDSAIELSKKIKDSTRLAFSYNRRGVAFYYLGDYSNSLDNYFLALSIKEKINDKSSIWREYNNIGLVLRNLEQNREALKYFKMVLGFKSNLSSKSYEATVWNNIGISYRGLALYDSAKYALEKALSINTSIGAKQNIALNYNNLANVYKFQGDTKAAEDLALKALEINKSLSNLYEVSQNLNNLGELYLFNKNYKKSILCLEQAYATIVKIGAEQLLLENLKIKADYYAAIKDYSNSTKILHEYSDIRDSIYTANKARQFNQLKVLANAEKEIQKVEFLSKINSVQIERLRIQHIIEIIGGLAIVVISFLLFSVIRDLRIKKKLNFDLKERSEELETLNEELISANEELLTQREELEQTLFSLKNTQRQLIQSEKMTSLGILAAGVAHEINNSLNNIQGGIRGLKDFLVDPEEHKTNVDFYVNAVEEGLEKATSIVAGLNHFSRHEDLVNENIDVHKIIKTCMLVLEHKTKGRINIETSFTSDRFLLEGNDGKMHQAIMNILLNAVQSIDKKGQISITTSIKDDKLELSIVDSGCGISEEHLSKIFDPFFTTKETGEGTGLGMSITYNIIQEFNGTIVVNSALRVGTQVIISLPTKSVS